MDYPRRGLQVDDYVDTPPSTQGAKQWYRALENGLRREIKEEVGIEIGLPEFFTDYTFIRPDGIPVLGLTYFAPHLSGEVKLDEDSIDFKWIKGDEAEDYDFIDGIAEEIRGMDQILKNRKKG